MVSISVLIRKRGKYHPSVTVHPLKFPTSMVKPIEKLSTTKRFWAVTINKFEFDLFFDKELKNCTEGKQMSFLGKVEKVKEFAYQIGYNYKEECLFCNVFFEAAESIRLAAVKEIFKLFSNTSIGFTKTPFHRVL